MIQSGRLAERKERPRKAKPSVVFRSLGRGSSKAFGDIVEPLKIFGRREARVKISILNKISIVSCSILEQSVLASTNRVV